MRGRLPKVGSYDGTGAVLRVQLGYKPVMVLLANVEDGDVMAIHFEGMTADTSLDVAAAVAGNAADGITLNNDGFSVGTDYSESGKTFRYIAF